MSKPKKNAVLVSEKPSQDALPPPTLLWQGFMGRDPQRQFPCRVVRHYVWSLNPGETEWEAVVHHTFEVSGGPAAMGECRYEKRDFNDLPSTFFGDMLPNPA